MRVNGIMASAMAAAALCAASAACAQGAASAPASSSESIDCKPHYPKEAQRSGAQGISQLAFHVDANGKVTQVDILGASGPTREHRLLDQAAAHMLALCPFEPARDEGGHPIASVVPVSYTWRLE